MPSVISLADVHAHVTSLADVHAHVISLADVHAHVISLADTALSLKWVRSRAYMKRISRCCTRQWKLTWRPWERLLDPARSHWVPLDPARSHPMQLDPTRPGSIPLELAGSRYLLPPGGPDANV